MRKLPLCHCAGVCLQLSGQICKEFIASEPKADPKEKELTHLIDLLRDAFQAGEDHAFRKGYYPGFKKWIEENDKEIKLCLNREL